MIASPGINIPAVIILTLAIVGHVKSDCPEKFHCTLDQDCPQTNELRTKIEEALAASDFVNLGKYYIQLGVIPKCGNTSVCCQQEQWTFSNPLPECGLDKFDREKKFENEKTDFFGIQRDDTTLKQNPWAVALLGGNEKKAYCSGSLISEDKVLTAGHCLKFAILGIAPETIQVVFGTETPEIPSSAGRVVRTMKNYLVHEEYDGTHAQNDIGIILLDQPVQFGVKIYPACLPTQPSHYENRINDFTYTVGYGERENGVIVLKQAQMPLLSDEQCRAAFLRDNSNTLSDYMKNKLNNSFVGLHCAQNTQSKSDITILGDSGGPMTTKIGTTYLQIASVQGGVPTRPDAPQIFVDFEHCQTLKFIREKCFNDSSIICGDTEKKCPLDKDESYENCNGGGQCNTTTGQCVCDDKHIGPTCEDPAVLIKGPSDVGGTCPSNTYRYTNAKEGRDACCCGPSCCWDICRKDLKETYADCLTGVPSAIWHYNVTHGYYQGKVKGTTEEVHCQWGGYGQWSQCSATCGGGTRSRTRDVLIRKSKGGRSCSGSRTQYSQCNTQPCPVNCLWGSWTAWSSCTKTCGGGTTSRTRKVLISQSNGGAACSGGRNLVRNCNTSPCPRPRLRTTQQRSKPTYDCSGFIVSILEWDKCVYCYSESECFWGF